MADECLATLAQAEGVLEMPATGQHGLRQLEGQRDWLRDVATRTPEKLLATGNDTHHRVIAAHMDGAIMREHAIGNRGEPRARIIVLIGYWLIAQVAAGHHQRGWSARRNRPGEAVQQEMVQRRV